MQWRKCILMNLEVSQLKSRNKCVGWDIPSHPINKHGGRIYMLVVIMQTLFKFMLELGVIFVLALMIACTVFVVVCVVRGDIKISIARTGNEKENEK